MSRDRTKKLLKKISALLEDEYLSKLEKDLAKKYIIEIYEHLDEWSDKKKGDLPSSSRPNDTRKVEDLEVDPNRIPTQIEDPPIAIHSSYKSTYKEPRESEPNTQIESRPLEQSGIIKSKDIEERIDDTDVEEAATLITPDFKREVQEVVTRDVVIPAKYQSLFQRDSQKELSEKLGLSPISDLRRALGINDKLLVVNELFAGKSEAYQETVDILNSKYSFSEAKSYLTRYVIDKFDWLDEEKIDPARDFIKLVERRFLDS